MKIKLKQNPRKEFLKKEIQDCEAYMRKLGPGDEYDKYMEYWTWLNGQLKEMSFWHKAGEALPWLTLGVTAVAGIAVPIYGMNKAYQEEEVEGKLKNGTVFNLATKQMKNTPKN